jgi:hypothetical protein
MVQQEQQELLGILLLLGHTTWAGRQVQQI